MAKRVKDKKKIKEEGKDIQEKKDINHEKQTKIIFYVVIGIILLVVVLFIFRVSSNNFKYNGIDFKKEYTGQIAFYTATIPIMDYYENVLGSQEVDFRNDPRTLKNIEVNVSYIKFLNNAKAYVSIDKDIPSCEGDTAIALINLGRYLSNALYSSGITVKGAMNDSDYQNNENTPYVNCENSPGNTVILVKGANETKIEQIKADCYVLSFKDCEVLKITEKFELTMIEDYMRSIT